MSDCTTVNNLDCFDHCDDIATGVTAEASGDFIVVFNWLGVRREVTFEGTSGSELVIPAGTFNESGSVIFRIKDPDGNFITLNTTECFKARVLPTF